MPNSKSMASGVPTLRDRAFLADKELNSPSSARSNSREVVRAVLGQAPFAN
jgi:hypothetical protein